MGLVLGVVAEAISHYDKETHSFVNFCNMSQYVFFDIGFETGVPIGRVVIRLNSSSGKSLTESFLHLARGEFVHPVYDKVLSYSKTPLHHVSSSKNLIMGGDVLFGNGSGGCAPVISGVWEESAISSKVENRRGKVVMLPFDSDPNVFTSIFYILLENSEPSIVDGCVIGDVIEGIDILDDIVLDYGTNHGQATKKLFVHSCGHL